ncbi:hypothetical protein [Shewanella youngdeokensis]|uniref:Uncharacterized protein n=1 Tax=Shewanella youngdeokensis TaxID=2999068 RepID=A0ABZ0K3E4_9GAMM|nr:hypothetical protein RGE70_07585 [Shewanella sp. DAU334]
MEPNQLTNQQSPIECDDDIAMLSELNRKRAKFFVLILGITAGLAAGFYGARWLYLWLFPAV